VIVAGSVAEARAITNRLAAEHLTVDAASDLKWVENAGSVFVGRWSAQPMGDYISGPNHTLPTGSMARVRGGLSVNDFVKLITVQEYTADGVRALGPKAALLAEAEGLIGHAEAIRLRWGSRGLRRDKAAARTKRRARG
jgi:histidinol dehydrogenase